ncbi:MAG: DUF445 family protein [Spirochaetales bacterium]|nr:DUF445 family protein [Spirochaetales bacterium]
MTTENLLLVLPWILPPVIGAMIGYITNAIAIKMLFRPLTEKRIFGIRIPFTPGIIPKQRYKLAESIGRMVSEQLITKDAVSTQLKLPQFQSALLKTIGQATGSLLDTPLKQIKERTVPFIGGTIENFIKKALKNFLTSESFFNMAHKLLADFITAISEKKLAAISDELNLEQYLSAKLHTLITEDEFRDRLIKRIQNWIKNQKSGSKSIGSLIPEELVHIIGQLFRSALPALGSSLIRWLRQANIRTELETKGKQLVKKILEKLNLFQRLIVSVAQYDLTLQEKMPAIVDDVLNYFEELLNDSIQRDRVVNIVEEAFLNWRKKELKNLFKGSSAKLVSKIETLIKKIWEYLREQESDKQLFQKLKQYLEKHSTLTTGELLHNYLGIEKEQIADFVLNMLKKDDFAEGAAEKISSLLFDLTGGAQQVTLGDFIGVDDTRRREIDDFLLSSINSMLASKLPEIIQSLNIQELVENKINQLDVADVEGLLLMVIAKQLKWINVFGALLGAVIGLSQIILKLLE